MNAKSSDETPEGQAQAGGAGGSLGEQLRRARIERGISLREISEQTRITMRHLEAIEADDYKHLPGGIFNRSFIKAYAHYIKFDEKRALDLYHVTARERGEPSDEVATSPVRSRVYMDGDVSRPPWMMALLSAAIVGILTLGIYALWHFYEKNYGAAADRAAAATPAPAGQTPPPAPAAEAPAQAAPAPDVAAEGLKVQLQAKDRPVWVTARQDDGKLTRNCCMLRPGEPRDFAPEQKLTLRVARADAPNLEVLINGRAARLPTDVAGSEIELLITKDNYREYLP